MGFKKIWCRLWQVRYILVAGSFLTGCVSQNTQVDVALSGLQNNDSAPAITWSTNLQNSLLSKSLGNIEAGRVQMLTGNFAASRQNFSQAIETVIQETDEGPVVTLGDIGGNVAAGTITDDRTRAYAIPPYEFIQALTYQMLNYLFLGDLEGAGVEARRAVFAQDAVAEKYGADVKKANDEMANDTYKDSYAPVGEQMQKMGPVLELTRSSYENPLAWYLCGVIFEEQNDISNASLSFRKAWELNPHNPYVRRDFLRLLHTQDPHAAKQLIKQYNAEPKTLLRAPAEVIVIAEESFVPQRDSMKIPLPVMSTLTSVDFPFYPDTVYQPMSFDVSVGDQLVGSSSQILNLQSLAYHDLKEKIPGIVIRNVTRVGTRIAAQQVANHVNDGLKYGVLAFNAISTIVNRADTRAWYTLPAVVHLVRSPIGPGERTITVQNRNTGYRVDIPLTVTPKQDVYIVWLADLGGCAHVATTSLKQPGNTQYRVVDSLLTGPRIVVSPTTAATGP